ncbi:unnamed protein product [Haemonchus placei]|uniref:Secreted protein n=1 Tax=Haemonchus placei TaxID=6290 RepID=A0A158QK90_HAEPC|nr:unnamed protein product [Haemonchus placei]
MVVYVGVISNRFRCCVSISQLSCIVVVFPKSLLAVHRASANVRRPVTIVLENPSSCWAKSIWNGRVCFLGNRSRRRGMVVRSRNCSFLVLIWCSPEREVLFKTVSVRFTRAIGVSTERVFRLS